MNATTDTTPDELRARMVDHITQTRPTPGRVADAMRAVPRHEFVPNAPAEAAYAEQAVITKRSSDGAALSCASVPSLVATMLDQLHVEPGCRVLEIGAGTGYNAALLAHLTGPTGQVTTIDVDPEVTAQASQALDATGHSHVNVITRDGTLGAAEHGPYDRIIVTVGAWDIPPAWFTQLAPDGRMVVPLRWRGQTRSIALTHHNGALRSDSVELCGFVPMIGQDGEHTAHIDTAGQVALHWDEDQPIDPEALTGALDQPKTTAWSGATVVANEPFDGVWLRLTSAEPGTCRIAAEPTAVETGLCTPGIPVRSPALAEGASLAYFALHPEDDENGGQRRWELGAIGHGPAGQQLANRLCDHIRAWDHARDAQPVITIYPADAPTQPSSTHSTSKRHTRLTVSY